MVIKQAAEEEIKMLFRLWTEKSRLLEEQGRALWKIEQFSEEYLKNKYDDPTYYICYDGENVVGGFILIDYDRNYWPEKKDDAAFYLHKLMVCNGHNGKGYSKMILDWLKDFGYRSGKKYVRLDYDHGRPAIKKMYTDNGFIVVEEVVNEDGKAMTKAEFQICAEHRRAPLESRIEVSYRN